MYFFILTCLFLGGCNPFGAFRPTSDELLSSNWAPNPEDPDKPKKPKKELFCYRTLGESMCYDHELDEGERNRLVGKTAEHHEKDPTKPAILSWIPYPFR